MSAKILMKTCLFVIINKLFSTKYPIDIFDLTNWAKLIILLPCFERFSLFSKIYPKLKLWVVKLLKLNIEKSWFDYQDTRCWSLAIQYELPNLLPGPNLQFRFKKNSVHTSLLGSLRNWLLEVNRLYHAAAPQSDQPK